jgi:endoglucanase
MRFVVSMLLAALATVVSGCASSGTSMDSGAQKTPKFALRVNCGSTKDYVDAEGVKWLADQEQGAKATWGAVGGDIITRTGLKIADTKRPDVYLNERYGMSGYDFTVPNGTYLVRLHFAETYEGNTKAGDRLFTVKINGQPVLKGLDILKEAGGFAKPLVKDVPNVAVKDGKLKIEFTDVVQNPEINGIEVLAF